MFQTNVELNIDQQAVQQYVKRKLKDSIQAQLWIVDLEKISELTCMSKRWLEEVILNDPRMKAIEIKKSRKRWYPAEKAFKVIMEITNEW